MHKIKRNVIGFLASFSRPYCYHYLFFICTALFNAFFHSFAPYIIKLIIDNLAQCGATISGYVYFLSALFIGLFSFLVILARVEDAVRNNMLPQLRSDIIASVFQAIKNQSYRYFQEHQTGSLASRITDLSRSSFIIIREAFTFFLPRVLTLFAAIITLAHVHTYVGVMVAITIIVFFAGVALLTRAVSIESQKFAAVLNMVSGHLVNTLGSIIAVKLFAREEYEGVLLQTKLDTLTDQDKRMRWKIIALRSYTSILAVICITGSLITLLYARAQGLVTVGDFALVFNLMRTITIDFYEIGKEFPKFVEEVGICQNALGVLALPCDIVDTPGAEDLVVSEGEIIFDKVDFRYGKSESIFSDKSITISSHQKVGLVGLSGSGKTTFVNLILRFFDLESGAILVDGQNIALVTQTSLHEQIGVIPQEPMLFDRTIMENIRYGRKDASDEDVMTAAKKAFCHDFIMRLPHGYNTRAGDRGVTLSGGQRQRISIARAILKDAPILILDEATSALDSLTEQYIKHSIDQLMADRTTIIIAHRLSTLLNVERILVFSDGCIIEDGTHEELIALQGHYAQLWSIQTGGFIPDAVTS